MFGPCRKVVVDEAMQPTRARAHAAAVPWRAITFGALVAVYVLLTLGVIYRSPVLTIDSDVLRWNLRQHSPGWFPWIQTYVTLGQRGPATIVALPWFAWRAWKSRSMRPVLMLVTALLLLNLSVGVVKLATGRLGPLRFPLDVHAVFHDGSVFPSGHTSNAVVLYGVIAMLVVTRRRAIAVAAVLISLTVGLSTVYLDTHWLSDVVGGWLAGGLVLLALPTVMPFAERFTAYLWARMSRRRGSRRAPTARPVGSTPTPVLQPALTSRREAATAQATTAVTGLTTAGTGVSASSSAPVDAR